MNTSVIFVKIFKGILFNNQYKFFTRNCTYLYKSLLLRFFLNPYPIKAHCVNYWPNFWHLTVCTWGRHLWSICLPWNIASFRQNALRRLDSDVICYLTAWKLFDMPHVDEEANLCGNWYSFWILTNYIRDDEQRDTFF